MIGFKQEGCRDRMLERRDVGCPTFGSGVTKGRRRTWEHRVLLSLSVGVEHTKMIKKGGGDVDLGVLSDVRSKIERRERAMESMAREEIKSAIREEIKSVVREEIYLRFVSSMMARQGQQNTTNSCM